MSEIEAVTVVAWAKCISGHIKNGDYGLAKLEALELTRWARSRLKEVEDGEFEGLARDDHGEIRADHEGEVL